MTIIKIEGSEKKRHTLALDREFMESNEEYKRLMESANIQRSYFNRCPICKVVFFSTTDRQSCSKECANKLKGVK